MAKIVKLRGPIRELTVAVGAHSRGDLLITCSSRVGAYSRGGIYGTCLQRKRCSQNIPTSHVIFVRVVPSVSIVIQMCTQAHPENL